MKDNNNNITEININLLFKHKNKFVVIGNVGFKLKNLWYYFCKSEKK